MSFDSRVLAVIQALYDAALNEALWPDALKELAEVTGSQAASFWVLHAPGTPHLPTFTYINFDPAFIAEYLDHVVPIDPTVRYLVRHPDQAIVHDGLVITEQEKDRHPYYDWHARSSDTRFRMVGQVQAAAHIQAGVALHRTRKAGPYGPHDIRQYALLHRHLERALATGFRLGSLGTMQQCTEELLDRNPNGILLLDERKRIVFANRHARALHLQADGVRVSEALVLQHTSDNVHLQNLIAKVIASAASGRASTGGTMRAVRPSGKRPYTLHVAPLSSRYSALSTGRPVVCIIIIDPDHEAPMALEALRAAFGLTEAEAKLAARLGAGADLRSAGQELGISYASARARLTDLFQKTNTRRQAELVRLLVVTMRTP